MRFPSDRKYTKDHEWTIFDGKVATIGITDHAQSALGDIVYLELPEIGGKLKVGDRFGVVESVKAVSDLYSPVTGTITATHNKLIEDPSLINRSPHNEAWMIKIEVADMTAIDTLLDSAAYEKLVRLATTN